MKASTTTVAAFDLDGTITDRDCVVPFLRRVAGTRSLTIDLLRHPVGLGRALVGRDRDALKQAAARAAFARRTRGEVDLEAADFARCVHRDWLRGDAVDRIARHRAAGDSLMIVSASFEIYVEPLADLLGVPHVLATRLGVGSDGHFTGELEGANCRGAEKVRRLHRWLAEQRLTRDQVKLVAYGDSPGDRELLAEADEAHWMPAR